MSQTPPNTVDRRRRTLIERPNWLRKLERELGRRIPLHPNVLSAVKLAVVTPLLLWCLGSASGAAGAVVLLFGAFAVLDYLDGVVARERNLATDFGRVFDRLTDYPLLIGVSLYCEDVVPLALVGVKIAIDLLLLALFVLGRGSTQNRLRTALSYTTLLALVLYSQSWARGWVTGDAIRVLLLTNIAFSSVVALYNLDILHKRQIANFLSFGNLVCGLTAIYFAWQGAPMSSLLMLLVGLTFDGFDGAAARRWGSTSWGVYADDVADGVNFALAPAAVLFFTLGGTVGVALAIFFATCTIGRLVYFTLDKKNADPGYFSGVPSPVGGLITVCSAVLFASSPAVVGLLVGVACTQMISFSTAHRHLGRLLAEQPRLRWAVPVALVVLGTTGVVWGAIVPVALLLLGALTYAGLPTVNAFTRVAASG